MHVKKQRLVCVDICVTNRFEIVWAS